MRSRGWGRVSASRKGQRGHLPGRPQGFWPVGSWLGSGLRALLPSSGIWRNIAREQIQIPVSPLMVAPRAPVSSSFPCVFGECILSSPTPLLHPPPWGSPPARARPHQREREAVPRLARRPPERQGEPVLVLGRQPAHQRPVGGAQRGVPPETERHHLQPPPGCSGVCFSANPIGTPMGKDRKPLPKGKGERRRRLSTTGELPPPPEGGGLSCPEEP